MEVLVSLKPFVSSAAALCVAVSLSGCYVVPIDPHHSLAPGQPVVIHQPGSAPAFAPTPIPAVLHARLYPLNETAGKMGPLSAAITDWARGHATFSVNHAGEQLQGEATRVAAGNPGFGRVHRQVYGEGRMPSGQRGIASATGSRGTYVNCEYALADTNRGTGACIFSNGATYQLHFGS
jgi:hypothetical protein